MANLLTKMDRVHKWLEQFADFAFPKKCALCDVVDFPPTDNGGTFCADCVEKLCPSPKNRCLRCGAETGPYATTESGCTHCRNRKLRFNSIVCLGMYEESLRKAILSAKWSFSTVRMQALATLLMEQRREEMKSLSIHRVIPIPQHWRQRLMRPFNPAWIMASVMAKAIGVPCDIHVLSKTRMTRPQKRVSVTQRFENQQDAFLVQDSHIFQGENVLLVDDVLTTGATCSEAAGVLKKAGAKTCHVAVLARVLDHSA